MDFIYADHPGKYTLDFVYYMLECSWFLYRKCQDFHKNSHKMWACYLWMLCLSFSL